MTAFDYARITGRAASLIARFGYSATLEKPGANIGPAYDPIFDAPTTSTITVVDLNTRQRDPADLQTGVTRRTLLVSTAGATPAKSDRIMLGTVWHEIDEVRTVQPGGAAVMFEVDLVT